MCVNFWDETVTRHAPAVVCYVRVFFGYIKRALVCNVKNCKKALGAFKQEKKKIDRRNTKKKRKKKKNQDQKGKVEFTANENMHYYKFLRSHNSLTKRVVHVFPARLESSHSRPTVRAKKGGRTPFFISLALFFPLSV